jgi:RNA polymerase sigma-70 factor (ECF subfamily)
MLTIPLSMSPPPAAAGLVSRARDGNAHALSELYARHGQAMMVLAFRLTGSRADAEDILHDVFLGLPEALQRYEERGSLESWLKRVTARLALTRLRSRDRRREVALDDRLQAAATDQLDDLSVVQHAIDALPDALRTVFVLREVEGYTHAEIAELLDITPNASEVRMHRAIKSLRRTLGAQP